MNLERLQIYAAAGYHWLRSRQGEDGAWRGSPGRDLCAYYKAPWGLQAAGDEESARRCVAHIERSYVRADRDLGPIGNPVLLERHPLYPHAFVAIGAAKAGRKDLANGTLDFLLAHRHPNLGAWGNRLDAAEPRCCDSISTACAGLALLEGGRLDAAAAAVDFLVRLLEVQPDPERTFVSSMYGGGELLTAGSSPGPGADRQVRVSGRFQIWWAISFPLIFLARFAEVSGEHRGLRAARAYLALLDRCRHAWDDISAGKAALGCAYLYRLTGEPGFRARAFKAARAIVSRLAADGGVRARPGGDRGSGQLPTVFDYEVTAEFALVLASVGEAVAQRDGSAFLLPAAITDNGLFEGWVCRAERTLLHQARIRSYQWHRSLLARWLASSGIHN